METPYDPETGICNYWKDDEYKCSKEDCPFKYNSPHRSGDGLTGCTVNGKIPPIRQKIEESKILEIPLEEQVLDD